MRKIFSILFVAYYFLYPPHCSDHHSWVAELIQHRTEQVRTTRLCDTRLSVMLHCSNLVVYEHSTYYMSLNGKWKFHWNRNPELRPKNFLSTWLLPYRDGMTSIFQATGNDKVTAYHIRQWDIQFDDKLFNFKKNPPHVPSAENEVGDYRRHSTIPAAWKGRRVVLCREGVKSFFYHGSMGNMLVTM